MPKKFEGKYGQTMLRLPIDTLHKLDELRACGYLPSAIMRAAVIKAVNEKLAQAKARGELNDEQNL